MRDSSHSFCCSDFLIILKVSGLDWIFASSRGLGFLL